MLLSILREIVDNKKSQGVPEYVIKNILKEYLQYPVLAFIYSQNKYSQLVFTGGPCLRICYDLPRLSEDLDFDYQKKDNQAIDLNTLANDLKKYFADNFLTTVETKVQSDIRVYLKFPILQELGFSSNVSESNFLYVKIEISQGGFINPKIDLTPVSKFGYNFIAKNYSLEYLMTGKVNAVLNRVWFKGSANEVDIKGRDFYDLYWYLQNNVSPNWIELEKSSGIKKQNEFIAIIKEKIEKNVTGKKLAYDLKNFFENQRFVDDFCENYKEIVFKKLDSLIS